MGSVAASGQGHMAMVTSFAGNADYAGVAVAGRLSTDGLGVTQSPTIVVNGAGEVNDWTGLTTQRWGDYSQVTVDPNDDQTMWAFEDFANSTNQYDSWGVRAVKLIAPPPAAPGIATPSSIPLGVASQDVNISGTSSSGSGFFDPGAGFANRLAVSVSGGVIVNSVTFTDATHITINISTVGATLGAVNVTVTNPDGQQVLANSFMTVTCGYAIAPAGETFGNAGGAGAVNVTTQTGCGWSVTNLPAWAATTSGGTGPGSGSWNYSVAANAGALRTQTVTVAGQPFGLTELGVPTKSNLAGARSAFSLANAAAQNWSSIDAVAGRSYCAQIAAAPSEQQRSTPSLNVFRADGTTALAGGAGITRACFVAPATETILFEATQTDGSSRAYVVDITETTLWANWFYIGGDYSSFSLLRNTAESDVHVRVTWRSDTGSLLASESITVPSGGVVFRNAVDKAGGLTAAGSVEIAHDGRPDAIVGSQTTLSATTGLSFDTITFQRRPQ
jgi:hypothetical protein